MAHEAHHDIVHDAQFDYYGKLLATASSDRTIRIYSVGAASTSSGPSSLQGQPQDQQQTLEAELKGHDGAVWGVAWAHPKFGTLLASCSYDRTVIVWSKDANGEWSKIFTHNEHTHSVNSVAWAPHELGLCFAAGSSDGTISVVECIDGHWQKSKVAQDSSMIAHAAGVNAVSWGPAFNSGPGFGASSSPELIRQLVSGGSDHSVKVWTKRDGVWTAAALDGHGDWVRDVAWAPNIGVPRETIASCSEDGKVIVWTQTEIGKPWGSVQLEPSSTLPQPVWSVSWSTTGNLLAVASGEDSVTIWKENIDGQWRPVGNLDQ